jgi:hypothetical protein
MTRPHGSPVLVPLQTEVMQAHGDWVTGSRLEPEAGLVVDLDVRRGDWPRLLALRDGVKVHWSDLRTVDIQELSCFSGFITYRLTFGDGWYEVGGERFTFPLQPYVHGIDLERHCTHVALRAAVLLAVVGGVGLRGVSWLLGALFHLEVPKSTLDRWVKCCASQLPDSADLVHLMDQVHPIREAHFDEIFTLGGVLCSLVLRDEHGRIFAVETVPERTEAAVVAFLTKVKGWGLDLKTFYVDGCEAYRAAIPQVFPGAVIQYDNFHVIQNIFRKLWKAVVTRRKELKQEGVALECAFSSGRLLRLAARIWDGRYLFFTRENKLSEAQRAELTDLLERDRVLRDVRGFVQKVWGIFEASTAAEAQRRLQDLSTAVEVTEGSAFEKASDFLKGRFDDMVAYLKHPGVKRNSLAETGIRCLRRLERGHDGFRGEEGLNSYVKLYQAIKYLGWTVYRPQPNGTRFGALALMPTRTG